VLIVSGLTKRFGGFTALKRHLLRGARGRDPRPHRTERLGKTTAFNWNPRARWRQRPAPSAFAARRSLGRTPDAICHRGLARTFQIPRPFRKLSILENVAVAAHFGATTPLGENAARRRGARDPGAVGLPATDDAPRRRWERAA